MPSLPSRAKPGKNPCPHLAYYVQTLFSKYFIYVNTYIQGRWYYYLHFTDEEVEAQEVSGKTWIKILTV